MDEYSFKLPDLGEGTVESEIVVWRAGVGDAVDADQPLVDMMTDKATIEITAPVSGTLVSVAGEPGDIIAVGAELAVFATEGDTPHSSFPGDTSSSFPGDTSSSFPGDTSSSFPRTPSSSFPRRRESSETQSRPEGDTVSDWMPEQACPGMLSAGGRHDGEEGARPQTSPAIRRLARERGIDLGQVRGTGPNGRITRADIEKIEKGTELNSVPGESDACPDQAEKHAAPETGPDAAGAHEIKLVGLRRRIAERMTLSASRIPHFSYVEEVDVTELDRLRRRLTNLPGADLDARSAPKLTYLPFVMQALVKVASEFPQCNAHFDDEREVITQFEPVHIGIAVQTADGLMVPVIRNVETLDLWQCAHELRQVAERARNGRARREELSGSTITITSLGALGGIVSTPIINYPEVAIIGINRTQKRPVFENNGVTTRLMMNVSSSFDHRVVDGHDAARAIQALKSYLESPATIFLPA